MIKIKKESTYLKYWDVNDLYGWAMSQKLPENNFDQTEDISPLNEDFTRKYMKKVMKHIFSKLMFNTLKNHMNFIMIYHFYWKKGNLKDMKRL